MQIDRLPDMVRRRRAQAKALADRLSNVPGVILPAASPGTDPAWWMFHFNVDEELIGLETAKFVELLNSEGIYAKHAYLRRPLFEEDMFQLSRRGVNTGYPAFLQSEAGLPVADDFPGVQEFLAHSVLIFWSDRVLDQHIDGIGRGVKKVIDAVGSARTRSNHPSDELQLSLT